MKNFLYLGICWILSVSTAMANCADVTGLQATPAGALEVLLSWDAVAGATKYQLEVELEEGGAPFEFWTTLTDNTYLLGGLDPNGVYKFKVRTVCGGEKASWSLFQYFSTGMGTGGTGGGACEVPGQLSALLDANGTASLAWAPVPGALLYEVEVESEENTPFFIQELLVTDISVEIPGLLPGGLYKFKVKSKCGGANASDFSAWTLFGGSSTGGNGDDGNGGGGTGGACETPTGLNVGEITSGSALISWNAVSGALEGYEVQVEDDENTPAFTWEMIVSGTQVTVNGLSPNGNYQVKVKAKCGGGNNSANTDWVFFSTLDFNGSTPMVQFTPDQGNSVNARITPNPAHTGEELQLKVEKTPETGSVWVMVYDLQGRHYQTTEVGEHEQETIKIPTAGLRPGMYQVVVRSKDNIQTRRFSLLD